MLVTFKITQILRVAWMQYRQWLSDPRLLIVFVLCIFSKTIVSDALIQQAQEVGSTLHFLEPFIAMGNSSVLVMFFPFVFLILLSDFPAITPLTLFVFSRTGKKTWFLGQILFLYMSILTYLLAILGFGCLSVLGHAEWGNDWSDAITKYSAVFPEKVNSFTMQFIPSNLYNQLSVSEAVLHTFFLLLLYFAFVGKLLMLFQLLRMKAVGLLSCIGVIGIGTALCAAKVKVMWAFPMANSIIWQHFQVIASEPIYPLCASYGYFMAGILLLTAVCYFVLKRSNLIGMM